MITRNFLNNTYTVFYNVLYFQVKSLVHIIQISARFRTSHDLKNGWQSSPTEVLDYIMYQADQLSQSLLTFTLLLSS